MLLFLGYGQTHYINGPWRGIQGKMLRSSGSVRMIYPRSDSGSYARPQNMKMVILVMPVRIAGIQVRRDAPGNIHVNLDSSTPCWNDAIEEALLKVTEVPLPRIFEGVIKISRAALEMTRQVTCHPERSERSF
jgi:hypothetical protein